MSARPTPEDIEDLEVQDTVARCLRLAYRCAEDEFPHTAANCSGGGEAHDAHMAINDECPWLTIEVDDILKAWRALGFPEPIWQK